MHSGTLHGSSYSTRYLEPNILLLFVSVQLFRVACVVFVLPRGRYRPVIKSNACSLLVGIHIIMSTFTFLCVVRAGSRPIV